MFPKMNVRKILAVETGFNGVGTHGVTIVPCRACTALPTALSWMEAGELQIQIITRKR